MKEEIFSADGFHDTRCPLISLPPAPPPSAPALLELGAMGRLLTRARLGRGAVVPNVFCVGAPKSGTSYIYSILREHSHIAVSQKDAGNLIRLYYDGPKQQLASYIARATEHYNGEPILADFEVGYMVLPGGAERIRTTLNPDARILICLRDPVFRAVSEYRMRLRQYVERFDGFIERLDFFDAVAQEDVRNRKDKNFYMSWQAYARRGQYFKYLKPFFDAFGNERVLVGIFEEDIRGNSDAFVSRILNFIGLRDKEAADMARADNSQFFTASSSPKDISVRFEIGDGTTACNETVDQEELLTKGIRRLIITSDVPQQLSLDIENPSAGNVEAAHELKRRHAFAPSPEQRKAMYRDYYAEDVARLEELLDRDLSCWYP